MMTIVCAWCGSRWASGLHALTHEFVKIGTEAEHSEKEDTKACTKVSVYLAFGIRPLRACIMT